MASKKSALLRLASSLPAGSKERKTLLRLAAMTFTVDVVSIKGDKVTVVGDGGVFRKPGAEFLKHDFDKIPKVGDTFEASKNSKGHWEFEELDFRMGSDLQVGERSARFEEGKPADPTENMSPEDKEEWEGNTEKYKDKFKTSALHRRAADFRVDYTTDRGNGGYFVVSAPTKALAKAKAREQVILNPGEKIKTLTVGGPSFYSSEKEALQKKTYVVTVDRLKTRTMGLLHGVDLQVVMDELALTGGDGYQRILEAKWWDDSLEEFQEDPIPVFLKKTGLRESDLEQEVANILAEGPWATRNLRSWP